MNEMKLSSNLQQIEFEIRHHKQIVGQSVWEIGRRLNHVKNNDLTHGQFGEWLESIGINHPEANRLMKVVNELPNSSTLKNLGSTALYLIASLPAEEREKEHITKSGDLKTPDQMTVRELQDLKKEIKQKDAEIEALKNREPEVIEKEIVKEVKVTPPDYENMRSDINQLSGALKIKQQELDATIKRNEFIENQYKEVLEDRKEDQDRKEKLEKIQTELERLAKRKNKMSDQIDTIKQLTSLKFEVDQILEKVSPFYFNQAINQIREDAVLEQSFMETVDSLQKWCDEMYSLLGKQNTFEGEIIND